MSAVVSAALRHWVSSDFALPPTVWLGGLFSPQSFLTAVIQTSGRRHDLPLDKLAIQCEVTKKAPDEFVHTPREGANISGLYMEVCDALNLQFYYLKFTSQCDVLLLVVIETVKHVSAILWLV